MKRKIVIAAVAAVALAGGGTATALAVSGDDEPSAASKSSVQVKNHDRADRDDRNDDRGDDAEDRAEARAAKVTAADAIAAALKHTPGTAVSAELDDEDGGLVWDVDVLKNGKNDKAGTWHSVEVDPGTGKVLGSWTEKDDDGDASRVAAALKGASVSAEDAAKAAAAKGTVTSVDLDDDHHRGAAAWETETTKGDWKVDLKSAKVTVDHDDED
ncbi:PepSY domain-containing protein [Streptomyces sp. NPDC059009]|uniref:PepSY domain-containing protein n=1 Tax=Streptomyces sp. NPDC059009 TaxID=3346694 RepID=UPI0036970CEE